MKTIEYELKLTEEKIKAVKQNESSLATGAEGFINYRKETAEQKLEVQPCT